MTKDALVVGFVRTVWLAGTVRACLTVHVRFPVRGDPIPAGGGLNWGAAMAVEAAKTRVAKSAKDILFLDEAAGKNGLNVIRGWSRPAG